MRTSWQKRSKASSGIWTPRSATLDALAKELEQMEQALSVSRSFTDGSDEGFSGVSAAALALAEKLETSQGAKAEVGALEVCIES
jgi:hypothetical protein